MPFGGLLTLGLISGGTSIFSGILGKKAADKASQQQADAGNKALEFQQGVYGDQKQNFSDFEQGQQPYTDFGSTSIAQLMKGLKDGSFGQTQDFAGPADFAAPSLEDARATPGYEFAKGEGSSAVLKGAAAAGGNITGGTFKALDTFGTGLADSTYNNRFNQALQAYQTNFGKNKDVYTTNLGKSAQDFSQLFGGAQLGENATESVGRLGSTIGQGPAANISDLMTQIGNAQASGTIGGNNALVKGLGGATSDISQSVLLGNLMKNMKQPAAG